METESKIVLSCIVCFALFMGSLFGMGCYKDTTAIKAGLVEKVEQGKIIWVRNN